MAKGKSGSEKPGKAGASKEKPDKTGGGHGCLEDDAALWARVVETAEPLTKKNRFIDLETPLKPPTPRQASPKAKTPASEGVVPTASPVRTRQPKITVKKALSPKPGLDRQTVRKLDKGNLAIEARIDLHGMRQREAHSALQKFLHWARGKDYRHVLVITGKGSLRDEGRSFYEEDARGVLRQAVPQWLSHGDLAPLIVSFSEAPRRLGGEGALYVRLRRSSRTR
ncbi:MAG: Smr/MutS family protein [Methyloceanibacter sp.]|jgi:DNA-nicking Smr family endonuclease|uniref:Smr/MutS family protein n=1 Tax=Methyloceanibacter sp. TaxID=1965321 RepID=UPI003C534980